MTAWLYKLTIAISKGVGLWFVDAVAHVVAVGYFLFFPSRLRRSVEFYRALFPNQSFYYALWCAWRQFQDFAGTYAERLAVDRIQASDCEMVGLDHIVKALEDGTGAIMVMSHFGRWEIGARLLTRENHDLTLLKGLANSYSPDSAQSSDLLRDGVDVVSFNSAQSAGTDVLEAVDRVRRGGIVALSGDRTWGHPRTMRLPFLGRAVDIPVAPFILALLTQAPLLIVFSCRTGRGRYRFECLPPRYLKRVGRAKRDAEIRAAGEAYLAALGKVLREHPEQWHTFEPFLVEEDSTAEVSR